MMLKLALLLLTILQRNGTAAGTCILFCSSQRHALGGSHRRRRLMRKSFPRSRHKNWRALTFSISPLRAARSPIATAHRSRKIS